MIATFTPVSLRGHQWVVVAQQPVAEAYAPIRHLAGAVFLAAVILAALAAGAVFVLQQNAQQLARARGRQKPQTMRRAPFWPT
jgi:uncharacterized protein HemX